MIIKNIPTTSATVKKVWNDDNDTAGKRPESLTVKLSDGTEVTLNAKNKWTATVDGLPKYDEKGKEIEYIWTEGEMPEGYSLESTKAEGTVTTITNKFTPPEEGKTSATVRKVWDDGNDEAGKRPESVTVTLSNGQSVTLSAANQWSATVEGLPKYDDKGEEVEYRWTEASVPGYRLASSETEGTVTTITNAYVPPEEPDEPTDPDKPSKPDKPTDPDEPTEPSKPSKPSKPTEPSKPSKPSKPAKPKLPKTGDMASVTPLLLLGAGIATTAAGAARKKRTK